MSERPRTITALKPCPFCGGKSELIEAPEAMNEGAMVVPIAIDCWNQLAAHDSSEQTIRADERERCARIAESHSQGYPSRSMCSAEIAAAIRSGK